MNEMCKDCINSCKTNSKFWNGCICRRTNEMKKGIKEMMNLDERLTANDYLDRMIDALLDEDWNLCDQIMNEIFEDKNCRSLFVQANLYRWILENYIWNML